MLKKFIPIILSLLLTVGVALIAGCAAQETASPNQAVTDVSVQKASSLMQENQANPDFIILDVRTAQEYNAGHLAGAKNLDFYAPTFRASLDALDKNKTYLVYCRSGNRSQQTINLMNELGFKKIYHMTGGIIEWDANKLPTVKENPSSFKNRLPLILALSHPRLIALT